MLILLKKYVSANCFQIMSKRYIFCINFYIMFVLLSNIFSLCQINIISEPFGKREMLNLTQTF